MRPVSCDRRHATPTSAPGQGGGPLNELRGASMLLEVNNLSVQFTSHKKTVHAVNGLSFAVSKGQVLAMVGESGCGKTVTCLSILGLNAGATVSGKISLDGTCISNLPENELRSFRGRRIAMVFQDPSSSLNPVTRIGKQLTEVIRYHRRVSKQEATKIAIDALREMSIPAPEEKLNQYPHEQSGGTNQRIMIAMALLCNPDVLLADEPTASLDATVQKQILQVFGRLREQRNMTIVFVTHNLGLVHSIADRVLILYHGMLMEEGDTSRVFRDPLHPYTKALLSAIPLGGRDEVVVTGEPPSPFELPTGCPYAQRCQEHMGIACDNTRPRILGHEQKISCHWFDRAVAGEGAREWPSEH